MFEFEILNDKMLVLVSGTAGRFLREQFFVEFIMHSANKVEHAAFLKYRNAQWADNHYMVVSIGG